MRFDVVTIFPEIFPGPLELGVLGRARDRGLVEIRAHDLRDHADPPHRKVDDEPFGGGCGMVFKPEPLFRAVEALQASIREEGGAPGPVLLMSPQGERLSHDLVLELAGQHQMTLVCGRYEGVDERIRQHLADREISIGDYVLTGGELPAMVLIEAVARMVPEALGDPESARQDSFVHRLLDHPHYTRPADFRGWQVPAVLRSGDHEAIRRWRRREALANTVRKRPDLLADADLDEEERRLVERLVREGRPSDR